MTKKKLTGQLPFLVEMQQPSCQPPVPFLWGRKVPQTKKGLGECVCQERPVRIRGWGKKAHFTEQEDGTQLLLISLINNWEY